MDYIVSTIIKEIKDFICSAIPYFAVVTTIISVISAILTCIGSSLLGVLMRFRKWKDRRVLEYIILKSRRDVKFDIDIIRPAIFFLIEVTKIFEILFAICIIIYSVSPWLDGNECEVNKKAYIYIFVCFLIIVSSALLYKIINNENIPAILYRILFLLVGNSVGIFIMVYLLNRNFCNAIFLNTMLACISLYNFGVLIVKIKMYSYRDKDFVQMLKLIRDLGGVFYIIYFYVSTVNGYGENFINELLFYWWTILCLLETLILIVKENAAPNVEFQINVGNHSIKTTKPIYQYRCNKIEYSLEDKTVEVIDGDRINSIDYITQTSHTSWCAEP